MPQHFTPQPSGAPALSGVVRQGNRVIPNRLYVVAPGFNKHQTKAMADKATALSRTLCPKLSGRSAAGIKAYWGDHYFGVHWDRPSLWYQEGGTGPFTMRNLAGKAQPLDELVLTPVGWQKMGSIEPGSQVIGSDGQPVDVVDVFPQGVLDTYRVTFSDGTSTRCSEDHLWTVRRSRSGTGKWEVRTTDYIRGRLQAGWRVPAVSAIHMMEVELPLDPYLVGVFLGDGCLTGSSPAFSAQGNAVPDQVAALLPEGLEMKKALGLNYTWTITAGARGTRSNPLSDALRRVGIKGLYSWEKFIPAAYLAGLPESRTALLQGLMDTDGSCSKDGYLRYHSCSADLAEDVANLVRGLGGHARVTSASSRDGHRPMHTVSFRVPPSVVPFRAALERRLRHVGRDRAQGKGIVSIEREGQSEMQCLLVDAEDSLYVTSGYTLTHNTIPMWVDDWTGELHRANPKAKTRITANGRRQILIFRKAGKIGARKRVAVRDAKGRLVRWRDVPQSYPGAPGRISHREWMPPDKTTGRISRLISRPHVGVRWRNPGLVPREFMQHAIQTVAREYGIMNIQVYATYQRG